MQRPGFMGERLQEVTLAMLWVVLPFGAAMMCLYCCCVDGAEWRRALAWIRGRAGTSSHPVAVEGAAG